MVLFCYKDASNNSVSEMEQHHRETVGPRSQTPLLSNMVIDSPGSTVSGFHTTNNSLLSNSYVAPSGSSSTLTPNSAISHSSFDAPDSILSPTTQTDYYRPDTNRNPVFFPRSTGRFHLRLALSPNFKRHKITINRDERRLLKQAEAILSEMADSRAVLEIAFGGEVGFGLGPTLEFYTLVSRQLTKCNLGLWHGCDTNAGDDYFNSPPAGFYPRPLGKHVKSTVIREVSLKFHRDSSFSLTMS